MHDTQPSPKFAPRGADRGMGGPPRLLFWGVILCFLCLALGLAAVVIGFREVLQPAQQQRVIDQLPFMRMFRRPTPVGGVFPTLAPRADAGDALSLLEMPLDFPAPEPTAPPTPVAAAEPTPPGAIAPAATPTASAPAPTTAPPPTQRLAANIAIAPADLPPGSARISGVAHQQQTWNNCGPATITMALSYYGWTNDQKYAGDRLKPNREDKNVSPRELADFVEEESFVKAIARMGGRLDLLKRLVAARFPVVIETGAMFEAYDWIGHYRVLIAYDDGPRLFYFFDSFLGVGDGAQGVAISYEQVDSDWRAFNRAFIVVYEQAREEELRRVLGEYWDEEAAAQIAFETARSEARREPQNGFAWFNMGTSLAALGRFEEAAVAFDQAHRTERLPWRMHWYQFGAFQAYFEVGRYDDVLSLARINQNNARELEETYYWRGRVQEARGETGAAAASYRRALAYNRYYDEARLALDALDAGAG